MAHKLRQIEILRKIDPPYVRCGMRWKFIPLALTFNTMSRALAGVCAGVRMCGMSYFFFIGLLSAGTQGTLCYM